uniref:NADH-ubiquinone oxidoreductase chain 3 n=1 Tax=Gerrhopilus ceylonicus TaxID=3148149 RepID=A0PDM3_9SAUR|nr:NADH dehydrogenase subunit 3 [Gerrhopilus mirus]
MNLLIMILISATITIILMYINLLLPNIMPNTDKVSPYECGFDPTGNTRTQISIQFFLVAILFLIFDLEIALLLPIPWAMNFSEPKLTIMFTSMTLIALALGLLYEWKRGGLNWAK